MAKREAKKVTKKAGSSKQTAASKQRATSKPAKKSAATKSTASKVAKVVRKAVSKATKVVKKVAKKLAKAPVKKVATKPAATKPTTKVTAPKTTATKRAKSTAKSAAKPAAKKPKPSLTMGVPTDVAEMEARSRGPQTTSMRNGTNLTAYEADEQVDTSMTDDSDFADDAPTTPALSQQAAAELDADIIAAATTPRDPQGKVRPHDIDRARAFAIAAARMCKDDKCEDVLVLDVSKIRQDVDFIVLASGTSDRQMRSVLQHLEEHGQKMNTPAVRASKDDRATWLLADFVDVVVHLFEPNTRAHYNLEMHFADAPKVTWEREGQQNRDRAGLMDPRNN
ncbi:MAG TPA: ribosome silencing factor [Phycisphaerales bacterium]|nr:ribosome silencing factor [Phycisphaerales bacterium]